MNDPLSYRSSPRADHNSPQNSKTRHETRRTHEIRPRLTAEDFRIERRILVGMGWPQSLIDELERDAHAAGVGIVQAAIAAGYLQAAGFYGDIAENLSFRKAAPAAYRIVLPAFPAKAWRFLQGPIALPLEGPSAAGVNAQTLTVGALTSLSSSLGGRTDELTLFTRQGVIDALTNSYGRSFADRAVNFLRRRRPEWSAKSGLAAWQGCAFASIAGLFAGAFTILPRETLTFAAVGLSLFFVLAVALRFCAALSLAFPAKPCESSAGNSLSDAELPAYTVFVPLFRETDILPYLMRALSELDYPGIMAQTPRVF